MLACDQCGTSYEPDDIDLELGVAHCASCDTVSELRTRSQPLTRPPLDKPLSALHWTDADDPSTLKLEGRWRTASLIGLLFFVAVWDGILGFFFVGQVFSQGILAALPILAMPHVWIGIGLAYYALACLVNTTVIERVGDVLQVRHGPVRWVGDQSIPIAEIDQVYVELSSMRINRQLRWNLCVMNDAGMGQVLVRHLKSESEGHWLEDRIERALAIENRPVQSESMSRSR